MTGTKLKVTVLYDLWEEQPAEVQEEVPAPRKRKGQRTQEEAGKARPRRDLRSLGEAGS
jgi:D-alanine-D-alanine ligase